MHLQSCLHPKIVKNKYTGQVVVANCGKCEACIARRQVHLCNKFDAESQCWPYAVFFTLTYEDSFLPVMVRDLNAQCYVVPQTGECLSYDDLVTDERNYNFILESEKLPYLRKEDAQNFIKRLRKICYKNIPDHEYNKLRYTIVGEYGETLARPHFHGILWFSSNWLASHIEECISSAWSLAGESIGRTDCSFVQSRAPQYVSTYITGFCDLPQIYQHKRIKPFCLYSKCPSIGTLFPPQEDLERIVFNGSPKFFAGKEHDGKPVYVPLWKDIQDSLFPKIQGFRYFNHNERVRLYGLSQESMCDEFDSFRAWCESRNSEEKSFDFISKYFKVLEHINYHVRPNLIKSNMTYRYNHLRNLWYISNRVVTQSAIFNLSISDYVSKIELFYQKSDLRKLSDWYKFQEQYVRDGHDVRDLIFSDLVFVNSLINVKDECNLFPFQKLVLRSYGYDTFSDFVGFYKAHLGLFGTFDYKNYSQQVVYRSKQNKDKKRQNEYLEARKEKHLNLYHFYNYGKYI